MPAAAVIPAPIAYIKVVAVKKLVVGFLPRTTSPPTGCVSGSAWASSWRMYLYLTVWCSFLRFQIPFGDAPLFCAIWATSQRFAQYLGLALSASQFSFSFWRFHTLGSLRSVPLRV